MLGIYIKTRVKNNLKCLECGYLWQATFRDFQSKNCGCPRCSGSLKHTHEFAEAAYFKANIKLLSHYVNNKVKNNLECLECGYFWQAKFNSFQSQNAGCPKCSGKAKHTQKFVEGEYLKADIKLLSVYQSAHVKNNLECLKYGHRWQANYHNFQSYNTGCHECYRLSNRGETSTSWNHELTKEDRENSYQRNHIPGYCLWVKAVYDRDKYICQFCGYSKGGTLNAHHIDAWSTHKSERLNVDNGVTLCKPCHDSYHYDFNPSVIDHDSFYHWMVLYSVIKPENWLWTVQYPKSMNGWLKAFKQAS